LRQLPSYLFKPVKITPENLYTVLPKQILDLACLLKILFCIAHLLALLSQDMFSDSHWNSQGIRFAEAVLLLQELEGLRLLELQLRQLKSKIKALLFQLPQVGFS
jgi:hypothetical protein